MNKKYEVEISYSATLIIEADCKDKAEELGCELFWSDGLTNAGLENIEATEIENE